ncbi:gluconate:H+ symporter [Companilactobacillus ginsenosidimutans]|uniref:Gluconate permease n=1 Tax=Companilactobacillus ginsenosidimutans TaxID=1007676 RepID=A0A0H4QMU9_9LACO|nr:gluconate:H+ symporter [Companilactobacillus ginsenosidimutans]AKP68038.1 gluconate permease [Companilactobacillus ginsenosidimutans]
MPFLVLVLGIALLLFLIIKVKLNTFVSLVVTSIAVGIGLGIPMTKIATSIQDGIGSQLGELSIVFGFGAMLGRLVADAGGAYRIAHTLIQKFGKKRLQLAIVLASFIIGIALFFEVGMVLLVPIVFAIAIEAGVSIMYLGIPMAAALSVTHGFLPPHPAPTAISAVLGASAGHVLLYGIIVAIPAVIIAGPLYTKVARKIVPDAFDRTGNLSALGPQKEFKLDETPGFGISVLTSLFPVILMAITTIYQLVFNGGHLPKNPTMLDSIIAFIGTPAISMTISLLIAMYTMGWARRFKTPQIMHTVEEAVKSIAMLLLVIGGGGAFKQVLIDGGVGDAVMNLFSGTNMSPLILGWLIAVVLRIALGSATVASLTAAGLVLPLMQSAGVNPALMVLAVGAGSLAASHVNDAGFWMFREYFDLTIKETLLTWTVLETIISVVGIIGVLLLSLVL